MIQSELSGADRSHSRKDSAHLRNFTLASPMQNVMQWLGNRLGGLLSAVSAIEGGNADTGATKPLVRARTRITAIGVLYTATIGLIDAAATKGMTCDFLCSLGWRCVRWPWAARSALAVIWA